jgi:tetratricopeptide (TPR) repeat protein
MWIGNNGRSVNSMMFSGLIRLFRLMGHTAIAGISQAASALVSKRGLTLWLLAACAVLAVGPWLRPPISRDFRGMHIPWGELASPTFLPELASQTPRPWRWNSIALPILAIIAVGAVATVAQPRWTANIFGLLLAVSMPALAVALWNYPTLIESFDGEMRDRALLRAVFRQHSEHMLAAGTPDRLAVLGDKASREDFFAMREHALVAPFRYLTYGMWLVSAALFGTIVSTHGGWPRRLGHALAWSAVGVVLACAATWPRWLAERHFAKAESLEFANRFAEARQSLERAKAAVPSLAATSRYWLTRGRLSFRQKAAEDEFQAFFLAHQAAISGDFDRARAVMERYVEGNKGTSVQRDLLAGIIARRATEYAADAKYSGAELCWSEAAEMAPWKPAYRIAHSAARLSAVPRRAAETEQDMLPRLSDLGDRMVSSDFHSLLGDAYFVSGDFARARQMYDRAIALFHLPKYANVAAQEGRLGM